MINLTKKQIKENACNIYNMHYCAFPNIQKYLEQDNVFINNGIYGWNCNVFFIDENILTIGYRPFGKNIPDSICAKYEKAFIKLKNKSTKKALEYVSKMIKEIQGGNK